jgi:hypothetical protein
MYRLIWIYTGRTWDIKWKVNAVDLFTNITLYGGSIWPGRWPLDLKFSKSLIWPLWF